MNNKELNNISDRMFKDITYYVIHLEFKIEVYNITNDNMFNFVNHYNFIDYLVNKIITQIFIRSVDKTITVFVRNKKEL